VPGDDDGHPIRVAADHCGPVVVITPAEEDFPRVQIVGDPLQLVG
jgi:hypothetical protein